jgi:hypothetical protein
MQAEIKQALGPISVCIINKQHSFMEQNCMKWPPPKVKWSLFYLNPNFLGKHYVQRWLDKLGFYVFVLKNDLFNFMSIEMMGNDDIWI